MTRRSATTGLLLLSILALAGVLSFASVVRAESLVSICAFNVQIFGQSFADDATKMAHLAQIVHRYDMTLIQEIRDSSDTAIHELVDLLESTYGGSYGLALSPRLGRSSSKEQYGLIYKTSVASVENSYVYSDTDDVFEREPFVLNMKARGVSFGLIGIHVKPDDAVAEIDALKTVYDGWAAANPSLADKMIIMGDLNADCSYVSNTAKNNLVLRTDNAFTWIVDDDDDTTTSSSNCAYDRFIVTDGINSLVVRDDQHPFIFHFDTEYNLDSELTEDISDHYPIQLYLRGSAASNEGDDTVAVAAVGGVVSLLVILGIFFYIKSPKVRESVSGCVNKMCPSSSGRNRL